MSAKPACKFGSKCYRKNKDHFKNYDHSESPNDIDPPAAAAQIVKEIDENVCPSDSKPQAVTGKRKPEDTAETSASTREKNPRIENSSVRKTLDENVEKFDLSEVKDLRSFVNEHNQMKMPEHFYNFLDFCKSIDSNDPKNSLKSIDLELAGVYDLVLFGYKIDYKLHSRFYFDPPEFQTLLIANNNENLLHFGYYRDDPNEMPDLVAFNEANVDSKFHCKGENLFAALNWYLDELITGKTYKSSCKLDDLKSLKKKLNDWCTKHYSADKAFSLQLVTPRIKSRDKKVNCKTFNQIGICVPVDSNGFGYREVPETDESQRKMFNNYCLKEDAAPGNKAKRSKADELIQEIISLIQFANDESDFGMGLEFALNMFAMGHTELHKFIRSTLTVCYSLLGRDLYAEIIREHLKQRKSRNEIL